MSKAIHNINFFDSSFNKNEQLPRRFTVSFSEIENQEKPQVIVRLNGVQLGNTINDNSYENDFYRYHDIFHYTFATMLGWSPCSRAMMRCKRKSNPLIDEIEDGARATITEESISLIVFNEAKRKRYLSRGERINKSTLKLIKRMTDCFEVKERTEKEWEIAIKKAYEIFRLLIGNKGGEIHFNMADRTVKYLIPNE